MINYNGQLLPSEAHFLNHENRGLRYGDALFETMRANDSKVFFWEDHYFRLMASMRMLRMEIPMEFTMEFLEEQIQLTLEANKLQTAPARIRLTVFRNDGGRYLPSTNEVSFIVETSSFETPFFEFSEEACQIELFKDHLVLPGLLTSLKTNNKIVHVVGSIYAKENGYQNCLLLNYNKQVVEALNGNIFLLSEGRIKTPPILDGCLNGIIRKQLLQIAKEENNFIIEEASISPFELQKADELFITNAAVGIQAVSKYRKASYGNETARNLLELLNKKAMSN